jgi:DNA gyrase subunit A
MADTTNIIPVQIEEQLKQAYLDYSMSVLLHALYLIFAMV